jgi:hypothetical protein
MEARSSKAGITFCDLQRWISSQSFESGLTSVVAGTSVAVVITAARKLLIILRSDWQKLSVPDSSDWNAANGTAIPIRTEPMGGAHGDTKFGDDVRRQVELGHAVEEDRAPSEEEDGNERVFVTLGVAHLCLSPYPAENCPPAFGDDRKSRLQGLTPHCYASSTAGLEAPPFPFISRACKVPGLRRAGAAEIC